MAYQSHHCSATLRCSVCISVFCTLLALSVLLPFMLSAPCPFNAPFPFCAFLLLRSASFFTPQSPSTTTTISSLFFILIVSVLLVHAICTKLLHAHTTPISSTSGCFLHFTLPQLFPLLPNSPLCSASLPSLSPLCLIIMVTLQLLWPFNPRIQHHWLLC
jgi:hypothetical protein